MRLLFLLSPLLAMTIVNGVAHSQDQHTGEFAMRQDEADLGTNIKRKSVYGSRVPYDKRYAELTAEQQAYVKPEYEQLGPNDEPPYPLNGSGPIFSAISKAQGKLGTRGELIVYADIDSKGEATSISVLKSPDDEMTKFVASLLMMQKYKPALCNSVPCRMQFPFRMTFSMQ